MTAPRTGGSEDRNPPFVCCWETAGVKSRGENLQKGASVEDRVAGETYELVWVQQQAALSAYSVHLRYRRNPRRMLPADPYRSRPGAFGVKSLLPFWVAHVHTLEMWDRPGSEQGLVNPIEAVGLNWLEVWHSVFHDQPTHAFKYPRKISAPIGAHHLILLMLPRAQPCPTPSFDGAQTCRLQSVT